MSQKSKKSKKKLPKQQIKPLHIALMVVVGLLLVFFVCQKMGFQKRHQCPSHWVDQTDTGYRDHPQQYMIENGVRREVKDYDVDWVKQHCNLYPAPGS